MFPNVPAYFTAKSMGQNATNPLAYGPWSHSIVLPFQKTIEIILVSHDKEGKNCTLLVDDNTQ